jgi:hypothetical protein
VPQDGSLTATGRPAASPLGQWSWALIEWARNPYYILIVIYIFGPYFSQEIVGDPIRGQAIWGYVNGFAGAWPGGTAAPDPGPVGSSRRRIHTARISP